MLEHWEISTLRETELIYCSIIKILDHPKYERVRE